MVTPAGVLSACVAVVAAVGGCTAASTSSVTATGKTLTIYASLPARSSGDPQAQDVLDAERLALQQDSGKVGKFTIKFVVLHRAKISDAARAAIEDKGAIAYLGELEPGASADSLGITNAQDLLQVSPTDTAVEETQSTAAVRGAPTRYYEALSAYGRTFARVVPNTASEAKAQVQEMQSLGVKTLYVADDGSEYGRAIAAAVRKYAAGALTVASSASGVDGAFFGGSDAAAAGRAVGGLGANAKLFLPSALADPTALAQLSPAARDVYVSTPGFLARDLSAAGQKFVSDFRAQYGHDPSWPAIFGYAAMAGVLEALHKAGASANDRGTVIRDFFSTHSSTVLGSYTVSAAGDTNLRSWVFSRVKGGQLVPSTSVQG